MRRNNLNRARGIFKALRRWHEDKRADLGTVLTDALADMRHLCDLNKLDFIQLDASAERHYLAELAAQDDPNFVK